MAANYGNARRGRGEGPHGHAMTQRFEFLKCKRWFRRRVDVELDTNVVFAIMLALGLEETQHRLATTAPASPLVVPLNSGPPPAGPPAAALPAAALAAGPPQQNEANSPARRQPGWHLRVLGRSHGPSEPRRAAQAVPREPRTGSRSRSRPPARRSGRHEIARRGGHEIGPRSNWKWTTKIPGVYAPTESAQRLIAAPQDSAQNDAPGEPE